MPYRERLVRTLWLISSLTLLASVLIGPARESGFVNDSPQTLGVDLSFSLPQGQSTAHLVAVTALDDVLLVNALPSEEEEQDRSDAVDEPRVSFLIFCSFRQVSDRQSIAPRSILSLYPLRC